MELGENEPLPGENGSKSYKVGLTFNLKKGLKSDVEDLEAEYDSIETVNAIKEVLENLGCEVTLLEADKNVIQSLLNNKPDIVFNIAEGLNGRGREAHIPALLNFLGIPFTGSDETTLCIALDKELTKRILSTYGIRTPEYCLIKCTSQQIPPMDYPVIVKPNAEGSSKGISDTAIVKNEEELRKLINKNCRIYNQPMLVEKYIKGREFTVAVIGNDEDTIVFPPMEIKFRKNDERYSIYSYNVKKNYKEYVEYICPPFIEERILKDMTETARKIYNCLNCRDFSRIDFRVSEEGEVYFIEINPLPGLAPGYSDFPMITAFNGISYYDTVKMVLNSGLKRYGMSTVG